MGWIVILFFVVLMVMVARKTIDHETTRNMKFLSKVFTTVIVAVILWSFLSYATH